MFRRLATLAHFALAASVASADDLPRVTSVNVCTDQFVMLLAEPSQVVSLSGLADDPHASTYADMAKVFRKNSGRAEAIAVSKPDIVVAHDWTDPALIRMLQSIGIEIVQFPTIRTLAEIPTHLRKMGNVLDQPERAEALAQEFEARLSKWPAASGTAPRAAFFYPNGYSLGTGTLSHDILSTGGAQNISVELGLLGGGTLSLEQILLNAPDFLIMAPSFSGFSVSEEVPAHPSLAEFPIMHSSTDWACGTPRALDAVAAVQDFVAQFRKD